MYLRYSSSVVAPTQCSSPRASAGFSMLPASIAPSALPAPTIVCSSSMKTIVLAFVLRRCPSAPPSAAPRTRRGTWRRRAAPPCRATARACSCSVSGTSPLTMRCARPSTIAVLPTPGSPISTGLFLVRRCRIWIVRRISSSRPITGSSLPLARALGEVDRVLLERLALALGLLRVDAGAAANRLDRVLRAPCGSAPCSLSSRPVSPLSSASASRNSSLAMNWSPRFCASLSVRLSRLLRSREMLHLAAGALDLGQALDRLLERRLQPAALARPRGRAATSCRRPPARAAPPAGAGAR